MVRLYSKVRFDITYILPGETDDDTIFQAFGQEPKGSTPDDVISDVGSGNPVSSGPAAQLAK